MMNSLFLNRWLQISVAGIISVVVFTSVGILIGSVDSKETQQAWTKNKSVYFATGMTVESIGVLNQFGGLGSSTQVALPITATEAVEAGWKDPVLCEVGRGRYFQKDLMDGIEPYILMFNNLDNLIGIYLFSEIEKPLPWRHTKEISAVDFDHWGLFVYFQDPAKAC